MRYLLIGMFLFMSGCSTARYLGERDEAWVAVEGGLMAIYYCKANKSEKGAAPLCFEAEMKAIRQ